MAPTFKDFYMPFIMFDKRLVEKFWLATLALQPYLEQVFSRLSCWGRYLLL